MNQLDLEEMEKVAGGDNWKYVCFDSWKWENLR